MDLFLSTFVTLFSVLNPIGNLPVFLGLTKNDSPEEKSKVALWSAINVFIILIIAFFVGEYVLKFLGLEIDVLRIAGGILICLAGFSLLADKISTSNDSSETTNTKANVAMTPLAIPLMAGPGTMSLLIAKNNDYSDYADKGLIILAVVAICVSIYIIFRSGNAISKYLGDSGMSTLSKIIGFFVLSIGIQYIVISVRSIFHIEL